MHSPKPLGAVLPRFSLPPLALISEGCQYALWHIHKPVMTLVDSCTANGI